MNEKKKCKSCGIEREISSFTKSGEYKDGHINTCKSCRARDAKKYRSAHLNHYRKIARDCYWRNREKCRERNRKYNEEHRATRSQKTREWHRKNREAIISHYGATCRCCGEKNKIFLSLDHINNNGNLHRRKLNGMGGISFYGWVVKNGFPSDLQLLCYNCNNGKRLNGGICPHIKTTP